MVFGGLQGQSYTGVTGVADSSYTNETAFEKTRKTHPNIKLVKPFKLANIIEEMGFELCINGIK